MSHEVSELTTHDLAVLESINGSTTALSQREIARRTGLSVGLINAVIRKLVHTGYVKTGRLNRRSIEYLLTPEGFAQTALKSYQYVLSIVHNYRDVQHRLHDLLKKLSADGITEFYLNGDCELAELVATFFEEEGLGALHRGLPPQGDWGGSTAVLNTVPRAINCARGRVVNLVHELGNGERGRLNSDTGTAGGP